MQQPPSFEAASKKDWVMCLLKSLYGMKQASHIWNQTFHKTMVELGFEHLACKWCMYRRGTASGVTIFAVHVDDIICASSSLAENEHFKAQLQQHWDISDLGATKFALGISISCDRPSCSIHLAQMALINRIVHQYGQHDAYPLSTPMVAGLQIKRLDKSQPVAAHILSWMEQMPYRSLIGCLNYLAVAT